MSVSSAASFGFTNTDIDVGCRLVEALVRRASQGAQPIGHASLLELARGLHPKDAMLGREVPVGIGMKLTFVAGFCRANGFPDLASLAVVEGDGGNDQQDQRRAVAAFDWSQVEERLVGYAATMRASVPRNQKPRKERPADVAWYAYFCSHREACAKLDGEDKKEIINLLMAGLDPDTALRRLMAAKAG